MENLLHDLLPLSQKTVMILNNKCHLDMWTFTYCPFIVPDKYHIPSNELANTWSLFLSPSSPCSEIAFYGRVCFIGLRFPFALSRLGTKCGVRGAVSNPLPNQSMNGNGNTTRVSCLNCYTISLFP